MADIYHEYRKTRNPSSAWNYFLTSQDRNTAKCKICSDILKTKGASTSGLHGHLRSKHDIKLPYKQVRKKQYEDESLLLIVTDNEQATSYADNEDESDAPASSKKNKRERSNEDYFEEYTKSRRQSSIWNYFLRSPDGQFGKCKICSKVLKTAGSSTSALHTHIKLRHTKRTEVNKPKDNKKHSVKREKSKVKILTNVKIEPDSDNEPANHETEDAPISYDESYHTEAMANVVSPIKLISRMAALDGIPLSSFTSSTDLCSLLSLAGYETPASDIDTITLILEHSDSVKTELTQMLKELKASGLKFSLVLEDYITLENKQYMSVNIYNQDSRFGNPKNLGLLRLKRDMESDEIAKLLRDHLDIFNLSFRDDIITYTGSTATSDIGTAMDDKIVNQSCLAQAIQYGVLDVLYKDEVSPNNFEVVCSDSDDDTEFRLKESKDGFWINQPNILSEPQLIYKGTVDKIRKIVRYYKNSTGRNDVLQEKVRKKFERPIDLILDCRTRWSSLYDMIGRFLKLKDCIHETLTYLEIDMFISDEELRILTEIHDSLAVIKATITALCKPSTDLLTADTALRFMLRKLDEQNNSLSRRFAASIRNQIRQKRTIMSSVLHYLHDKYSYGNYSHDDTFIKPTSEEIVDTILLLLRRLKPIVKSQANIKTETNVNIARNESKKKYVSHDPLESDDDEEMSIEKQLERELKSRCSTDGSCQTTVDLNNLDLKNIIMGEISIYESTGGSRGLYLTVAYEMLLSVKPAVAEADHYFYSKRDARKVVSSLPDVLLSALFLLRSYFKENATGE